MDFSQISEFASNHIILCSLAFVFLVLVLGNEMTLKARSGASVSTLQLVRLLNQNDAQVLDVRELGKFNSGHIIDAFNLSLENLAKHPERVKLAKDKPVVVADELGTSAGRGATLLKQAGFAEVYILKGGMTSWTSDNLPVEK